MHESTIQKYKTARRGKNARKTEKTPGDTNIRVRSRLVYWLKSAGGI